MKHKFLNFRQDANNPFRFDFKNEKRWRQEEGGRSFKLHSPDFEKDRLFATAEIKAVELGQSPKDSRIVIEGIANANIVDRMEERLDPRGLDFQSYLKNSVLLAHHSYYHPIGQVESLDIQDDGVHFRAWVGDASKGELTDMQREIRSLVSQGVLRTVSVGFIPKKVRAPLYDENGEMEEPTVIEEWELLELSVVSVPANQNSVFAVSAKTHETLATSEVSSIILPNESISEFLKRLKSSEDYGHYFSGTNKSESQEVVTVKTKSEGGEVTLQTVVEAISALASKIELIVDKLGDKPADEEEPKETPKEDEEEDEDKKALDSRITKLEDSLSKVVKLLEQKFK
jgi:HK97 family phage prohead protease